MNNSKWFYSSEISAKYIDRLKQEMINFPLWHDDALNICAYLYDILRDYHFLRRETEHEKMLRNLEQKRQDNYNPLTWGLKGEDGYNLINWGLDRD